MAQKFPELQVTVADYEDGAMSQLLSNYNDIPTNLNIIHVNKSEPIVLPDGCLIILASHLMRFAYGEYLPSLFKKNNHRLLFWTIDSSGTLGLFRYGISLLRGIGYYNAIKFLPLLWLASPLMSLKIKKSLILAMQKNSLISMSKSVSYNAYKYYNIEDFVPIIPLLVDKSTNLKKKNIHSKPHKIAYLGRFQDAKYWALENLIFQLNEFNKSLDYSLELHIIGYGPYQNKVLEQMNSLSIKSVFHGKKSGKELENIIYEMDILFGCGTSIIEALKLGIPSVLIVPEFKKFRREKIGYFCLQSKNGEVGNISSSKIHTAGESNYSLDEIFKFYKKNYNKLPQRSSDVFEENFSVNRIIPNLAKACANASLTINHLEECGICKYSWNEILIQKTLFCVKKLYSVVSFKQ